MKLLKMKYPLIDREIPIEKEMKNVAMPKALFHCFIGVLSYICPKVFEEKIYTSNVKPVSAILSKKITIYDIKNKKAYYLQRDYKKAQQILKEYRKICKEINEFSESKKNEWKERVKEITNLEFWKQYLEIE